jgi:outer membrane protein assembly factor BamB
MDLRTGEELWRVEGNGIDAGQHFMFAAPNGQGVRSLLWDRFGDIWDVYDPFDGKLLFSFENATSGTNWWWEDPIIRGEDGEMYILILDGYANSLSMWNSTRAFQENGILQVAIDGTFGFASWIGLGEDIERLDWEAGIEWSVTIPDRNVGWHTPYSIFGVSDGVALAKSGDGSNTVDFDIGYDIETGAELWANDMSTATQGWFSPVGEGVYATFLIPERRWVGYSITTGAKLWDSDQNEYPWGSYVSYAPMIAYGKLLSGGWDGYLHAFDITDGSEAWKFYVGDSGSEHVSGTWPVWNGPIVADGVAFVGTGEETPTQPLTRGNKVFAVDVETGEEIWSIAGYMSLRAVAEGYLLGYNGYDSKIYCFGKGPSATTVTAPKTEVTLGESVIIEGTVTDQSAGAMGTPAISDEDMGPWMEYMYMQKPFPGGAKGVDVSIDVVDANGNFRNIGTATSDVSGKFGLMWEPDISGMYTIIATFAGSESYGSSFAQTYMGVVEAPQPTPPPDPTPAPMTDTYVLGLGIAAIIAIIVMGLLILWKIGKK